MPRHDRENLLELYEEKAKRAARLGCLAFTKYTMPDYVVGAHHRILTDKLDEVERGKIKRLMVFMPPRHGKSEIASKRFPAWFLGKNPTKQVITASYGATLAQSFGRDVRNIVMSPEFGEVFAGVSVAPDSAAKDVWHTRHGGVYVAMGVGGGLTGRGAHVAIIDDPVKDRQDAESLVVRDGIWDWYRSVIRTRLMPNGAIVLVMTRWHPDDLAGSLLADAEEGGEQWEVISLPAVCEEDDDVVGRRVGDPLWPAAFPLDELREIETAIGPREWSSLYQQSPTPGEGILFKVALIDVLDAAPANSVVARKWDLAATKELGTRDPDWTAGVKMARLPDGRFCVLDVVRFRGGPDEVEAAILATASQDGRSVKIILPQDPGQAGKAQAEYLARKLARFNVEVIRETGDKATRAAPFASQVNVGNVCMVSASWNRALLDEMRGFPAGSHDDQIDALAGAFDAVAPPQNRMPKFTPSLVQKIASQGRRR